MSVRATLSGIPHKGTPAILKYLVDILIVYMGWPAGAYKFAPYQGRPRGEEWYLPGSDGAAICDLCVEIEGLQVTLPIRVKPTADQPQSYCVQCFDKASNVTVFNFQSEDAFLREVAQEVRRKVLEAWRVT